MNTIQIEENLDQLVQDVASGSCSLHEFPFRLMEAYEASRNEVNKLRMKFPDETVDADIVWPKKLLFRPAAKGEVQGTIDILKASLVGKKGTAAKNAPRFLMSTDGDEFLALCTKTGETPSFDRLADLPTHYDFLQPMFGVERYKPAPETTADVRAARHMAKFHDAILARNPDLADRVHELNQFMTRILFCMFAEDTGIFPGNKMFVQALRREALAIDGTDTKRVIEDIFRSLNIEDKAARSNQGVKSKRIAEDFPYVNGGLFRDAPFAPDFDRRSRRLLLEAADLKWSEIHADIFGSMIQAVVHKDMRADFGMHYTSVPNIMKVLEPLFLASLREQLTAAGDNVAALKKLTQRISSIRIFDPACGSGNFLIIAYRELRLIETEAFRRIRDVQRKGQLALADFQTGIKISNFFGIDPVDFACETAKLSLWISQYQMNRKLDEICSAPAPALPLSDAGCIIPGNALQKDWIEVCPIVDGAEVYIVGNPPYLGRANQTPEQKQDIIDVFSPLTKKFKKLDYVACWFVLGSRYLSDGGAGFAFVATNSICQGEQVGLLWPNVLKNDLRIVFAHQAFRWSNSAAKNAGVTCIIVGVGNKSISRRLYSAEKVVAVDNINAYLADAPNLIVYAIPNGQTSKPMMRFGNMPVDDGELILSLSDTDALLASHPESETLLRPFLGSREIIDNTARYCLWIHDRDLPLALSIPPIRARIEACATFRRKSKDDGTRALADRPHQFREMHEPKRSQILVPRTSSERRLYLPITISTSDPIISTEAFSLHDPETWLFSVLGSRLHITWAKAVAGGLETRLRYSNTLVYNTFPIPHLSEEQRNNLETYALEIIRAREPYLADGRSLGWLYDPETMPIDIRERHRELDDYLEAIYIGRPFRDDAERLEHLFKLYARHSKPRNS